MTAKVKKVLVIGDSCDDLYVFGKCDRLSPEAPVPVLLETKTVMHHGMAFNVYQGFLLLGIDADIVTNSRRPKKIRYIDERTKNHLLRVDIDDIIDQKFEASVDSDKYSCLVICDYNKGFIDFKERNVSNLISLFLGKNLPVFVDSKKVDLHHYSGCILKMNDVERSRVKVWPEYPYTLITTSGKSGAELIVNGEDQTFPIFKADTVQVADVCGAGDSFMVGLVSGFIKTQGDMSTSMRIANRVAAISVQNFGTHAVSLEEIRLYENNLDKNSRIYSILEN